MGYFYEGISLGSFGAFVLFVVALLAINEATRKSIKISIFTFCILPVVLAFGVFMGPLGSPTGNTWFGWVKVVSALAGVYGFMLIRFTSLGKKRFAAIFPLAILSINIAEAVYREFEVFGAYKTLVVDPGGSLIVGGPWNILNAIAGILCIVTLTGFAGIRVSNDKTRDMIWPDMTWMYIIGYTLWNFSYVYNCISVRSMYAGFGILLAALVAEFVFKKGAWLQHRAQILSVYAMFSLSVDFQSASYFQIIPTYNQSFLLGLSIVSFVFNMAVFYSMVSVMVKEKKNPLKEELYTNTSYYSKVIAQNNLG